MTAIPQAIRPSVRLGWVVGPFHDLAFVIGGALVSFLFLALHLLAGMGATVLWWLWVIVFDGPHIFATLSRTYLDAEEWKHRRKLLIASLGWFALGPLIFAISASVKVRLPVEIFFAAAGVWAYWHLVRQHYGIMVLYKKKNVDLGVVDNWIDNLALYGLLAPFVSFVFSHPEARRVLGLKGPMSWEEPLVFAGWCIFFLVAFIFVARQWVLYWQRRPVNVPKILLLSAVFVVTGVSFAPAIARHTELVMFFVVLTAFHNVQYHAIVWFYHRNRYHRPKIRSSEVFGLAPKVSATFFAYAVWGMVFALTYRAFGCSMGAHPGCESFVGTQTYGGGLTARDLAQSLMWGFALHHYYLDQKIWRTRSDVTLNRDLELA